MKASDSVKEKRQWLKLKEVKAKSEDSGSKARQYLDGLLKIPFGIYKKEQLLSIMDNINDDFKNLVQEIKNNDNINIPDKNQYSSIEIERYSKYIQNSFVKDSQKNLLINL